MATFPYKTQPYEHQRTALRRAMGKRYFALFMEQRTGKTKVTLDEAAYLWLKGDIDALVIIAPSGVHSNWVRDEIPLHLSDDVPRKVIEYYSSKARQKLWPEKVRRTLHLPKADHLLILAINIEAITTEKGKALLTQVLKSRRTMMVIDESTDIKTPNAKRRKTAKSLGKLASYRRILSGFPDPEGPLDMFAQLNFLSPSIVGNRFVEYKARYGVYEQVYYHGRDSKPVPKLTGFQNLDELTAKIAKHSYRVRRDECMDLPPKVYTKRYIDMSVEQWRMYEELKQEWATHFKEDGEEVTAELSIVRQGRLQQIASGYVPTDNPEAQEPIRRIPGPNPRFDMLKRVVEEQEGSMIIWCRWKMDIDLIVDYLGEEQCYRYDGEVKREPREVAKAGFQLGDRRIMVANPAAASRGLTWSIAETVVYFSHYWGLEMRVQSEDRAIGKHQVLYVDLLATDTVDERIVRRLREKNAVARPLLGDPVEEWI